MLRTLAFRGFRKGLVDGSRPWLAVGVVAGVVVLARRILHEAPETVFRHALEPGEGLVVRVLPPPDPEGA